MSKPNSYLAMLESAAPVAPTVADGGKQMYPILGMWPVANIGADKAFAVVYSFRAKNGDTVRKILVSPARFILPRTHNVNGEAFLTSDYGMPALFASSLLAFLTAPAETVKAVAAAVGHKQ